MAQAYSGRSLQQWSSAVWPFSDDKDRPRTTTQQTERAQGERLGRVPLGIRPGVDGDQVAEDEPAPVRLILRRRARGVAFRAIASELTLAGYRTQRGGAWHGSTVRAVWNRRRVYRELLSA